MRRFCAVPILPPIWRLICARLVAVPSVGVPGEGGFPFGSACAAVLDAALALGEKYGFVTENHEYCCGSILFGEGEKEVGIVTHLDVVPRL